MYGYYEWLEIREAPQREKPSFKQAVEEVLDKLFQRMSQQIQAPPLEPRTGRRSAENERPSIWNETGVKFSRVAILKQKWKYDMSMLNTKLPDSRERALGTIITQPCHSIYYEDG